MIFAALAILAAGIACAAVIAAWHIIDDENGVTTPHSDIDSADYLRVSPDTRIQYADDEAMIRARMEEFERWVEREPRVVRGGKGD